MKVYTFEGKTIGQCYTPLIEFAIKEDKEGFNYLEQLGRAIFENNKMECKSIDEGIKACKDNLDYYCQYYDVKITLKVKRFYRLGTTFMSLHGKTMITMEA